MSTLVLSVAVGVSLVWLGVRAWLENRVMDRHVQAVLAEIDAERDAGA